MSINIKRRIGWPKAPNLPSPPVEMLHQRRRFVAGTVIGIPNAIALSWSVRFHAPATHPKRKRGRPHTYSDRLFLQALVIMSVRRLHKPYELLTALQAETDEMQTLRTLLTKNGRYPSRRTWYLSNEIVAPKAKIFFIHEGHQGHEEQRNLRVPSCPSWINAGVVSARLSWERRLKAIPSTLPAQIGCLGRYLVNLIQPWQQDGRAGAIDSTVLRANGGVWHKKDREHGSVPHTSMDTEAAWTKSGWHGWVYGWTLHLRSPRSRASGFPWRLG